jgi:hypothetical protein
MLPEPGISDDSNQKTNIGALICRQAQIRDVAKTDFSRDGFYGLREIMFDRAKNRICQSRRGGFETGRRP